MKKILVYLSYSFIVGYAFLVAGQYWVMYMDIDYYLTMVPIDKWYAWISIGVHTGFAIMLVTEYLVKYSIYILLPAEQRVLLR